mgnify:CR=1 FL=1
MTHQLIPFLKRLRLSGILETLEVRNQQAIANLNTLIYVLINLRALQRVRAQKRNQSA